MARTKGNKRTRKEDSDAEDVNSAPASNKKPRTRKSEAEKPEPKTKAKKEKVTVPELPWKANKEAKVWAFIGLLEANEGANVQVLRGKPTKDSNTVGESKTACYNRLGRELFPDLSAIDEGVVGSRVKSKYESIVKRYGKLVQRLRVTGGGLDDPNAEDEEGSDDEDFTAMKFYVGSKGPDEDTSAQAKNLWDKITKEWAFFPRVHATMSTRPNVVPICITTGVTPSGGPTTLLLQPLDPTDTKKKPNVSDKPVDIDMNDAAAGAHATATAGASLSGPPPLASQPFIFGEATTPGLTAGVPGLPAPPPPSLTLHQLLHPAPATNGAAQQSAVLPGQSVSANKAAAPSTPKDVKPRVSLANTGAKPATTAKKGKSAQKTRSPKASKKFAKATNARGKGQTKTFEELLTGTLKHTTNLNYVSKQRKQDLEEKKFLLDSFKEGAITKEEYKEQVKEIEKKSNKLQKSLEGKENSVVEIGSDESEGSDEDSELSD